MPKTLRDYIALLPSEMVANVSGDLETLITAPFVESSRDVEAGGVFVARQGLSVDGHQFIGDAVERGAVAIIGEKPMMLDEIPYIEVNQGQKVVGMLAAHYYDFPSRKMVICGVTGTNGKTTTTHLLHQILNEATGGKAGFISTIGADFGGEQADTGLHVTTPTAPEVQAYLARMADAGLTHVVLEMTSHGLEQGRLSGTDIDVAIVTNVTHEHLDFHGSFENYRAAKGIMYDMLSTTYRKPDVPKISILNADDGSFEHYRVKAADQTKSYGIENAADHQATAIEYAPDGTHFSIGDERYTLKLVGAFNISNALAAISAAKALGFEYDAIQAGLSAVSEVSGRMERIDEGQDFIAIVDFAHTPDALEKAIEAARTMLPDNQRVIVVFGSAGLRDVEKRRMMSEVSARLADVTVLTAEDPRTESLDDILKMMADGAIAQGGVEGETFIRVTDRGEAIYQACQMANPGDLVMACGKGHEQSMCFGTIEYDWDDRDAMRAALRGQPLATLPTAQGG